jgi:hypothetical protein
MYKLRKTRMEKASVREMLGATWTVVRAVNYEAHHIVRIPERFCSSQADYDSYILHTPNLQCPLLPLAWKKFRWMEPDGVLLWKKK